MRFLIMRAVFKQAYYDSSRLSETDIEQFGSLGISMMLEGFENNIDLQEMADLLTFLRQ